MIEHLDNLLRNLFLGRVPGITDSSQVRFEPPDDDWRTWVSTLMADGNPANALNIYLVDLRENRNLRSNERARTIEYGIVSETPAPTRMDCHYLISAWSPATPAVGVEPPLDEHRLLHDVLAVLVNHSPLNPTRIYPPGSAALTAIPEPFRNCDLPTQIAPVDGFPKLPEFWGTMGASHRWKPVAYVIVTLPVAMTPQVAGTMVTTRITEYRQTGILDSAEIWIQIGGHVFDATVDPAIPVPEATVRLENLSGEALQVATTNALGRFTFADLHPGSYQLRYHATGQADPPPRVIDVPSPSGEYDLRFE